MFDVLHSFEFCMAFKSSLIGHFADVSLKIMSFCVVVQPFLRVVLLCEKCTPILRWLVLNQMVGKRKLMVENEK